MQNKENNQARRGPGGPGMRGTGEKAKDFKGAIVRLFQELKGFRALITVALVLAALGSILSIIAPNRLSELTDEISEGLVIKSDNLEEVTKKIQDNFSQDNLMRVVPEVLEPNFEESNIASILMDSSVSQEDQNKLKEIMASLNSSSTSVSINNTYLELTNLSDSVLERLFPTSTYKEQEITSGEKVQFLRTMTSLMNGGNLTNFDIPDSIGQVLLDSIKVDGVTISSLDQIKTLKIISSLDEKADATEIYEEIDKLPKSIKKVVEPYMNISKIKKIVLFLVILYLCSALFTYIESLAMTSVSNNFARKLRNDISKKINRLPLSYFDRHVTGDILSRVTNDVDTIAQSMNQSLSTLVSAVTLFIGTIIMMFVTNWIMALTAILSSLFGFFFMFKVLGKSQKYFVARQVELGNLNGHIEEVYSGLNVVKAYNGKKEADSKFDSYNEKVYLANKKSQFLSGLMYPMMNFIGNFGYVAVCVVGAMLTMNGHISFGVIVAFITYVRLFTSPLSQIAQAMTSLQSTAAASERVFEFIDEKEMPSEENVTKVLDKNKVKGKIEFKNIVFTYEGNDEATIKDFSAKALPGQKIAIVGPTGAGKTTMVNLLMKFYDIDSGEIKIDNISTKELTRENIHELFTMVLQDTWLFNGTIKENIIYNQENVSDEEVIKVCKTVGLDHFIKTLPDGYDTVLSDNDSVSAGQRQLLTIARGMIQKTPFLILDEATSNVDTRTEELVQKAMDKLTEGKTSFIIAHRLSTIKNADLILVMKDGNIIETGNHQQLMKKNGFYAELYNSQFEL